MNTEHWSLRFYKDIAFKREWNAHVDDLPKYLATKTPVLACDDFAPFTPQLSETIKIDANDDNALFLSPITYLQAWAYGENGIIQFYYFFVTAIRRLANGTCAIDIEMDTINTYLTGTLSYNLSPKTLIKREHVDRWENWSGSITGGFAMSPKIDRVSEGMQPRKIRTAEITGSGDNYYLLYKTSKTLSSDDLSNPVNCYLCGDNAILAKVGGIGSTCSWTSEQLNDGYFYYIIDEDQPAQRVTSGSNVITLGNTDSLGNVIRGICFYRSGSNINVLTLTSSPSLPNVINFSTGLIANTSITFNAVKQIRHSNASRTDQFSLIGAMSTTVINAGYTADSYCMAISSVDRTDSRFLKIIKLPYAPSTITTNVDGTKNVAGFTYDQTEQLFKSSDISQEFKNNAVFTHELAFLRYTTQAYASEADMALAYRGLLDPKLYNSDFFNFKINYDSFSITIPLEFVYFDDPAEIPSISIDFKPTNTINSNFAFRLRFINNGSIIAEDTDYSDYLITSRNNELTIFSNSYIDYIKTGYNYDKKSKAISTTSSWVGTALSIGGGVATAAVGAATGNAFGMAAGVALTASALSQLSGSIATTINNENSMTNKLAQLKAQSTNTTGADDIDLLQFYGNNKLRYSEWRVTEQTQRLLNDLFYYFGYARNTLGIPDIESRYWFNFVQCTPVWNTYFETGCKKDILNDLASKFENGITFFHNGTRTEGAVSYDFAQEKENWEIGLLPRL